jgi:glycosyltransferase involved in cell wall biosynthesis
MRIGIDATPLREQLTGVGTYLHYLLNEIVEKRPKDHFILYAIRNSTNLGFFRKYRNTTVKILPFLGVSEALWSQTTLAWHVWQDRVDVFWGSTQSLPLVSRTKNIITIYDFAYRLHPKSVSFVRGTYLRLLGRFLYRKAHVIVTISKGTANRLENMYKLKTDAVIIPPLKKGPLPDPNAIARYGLKAKSYFLIAGTLEPRKNILPLLRAYPSNQYPLVLAGGKGWRDAKILKILKTANQNIKVLGYVCDNDLRSLIQNAKALLMPSLYEGYGMPIAEARSLGTPVLCNDVPEMIEAAEGDATLLDWGALDKSLNDPIPPPKKPAYPSNSELAAILLRILDKLRQ